MSINTSMSILTEPFVPPGIQYLVQYRDHLQSRYDVGRENTVSYVPKFVLIEAGFIALTVLCIAEAVARYVASWGLYIYNAGHPDSLTDRAFDAARLTTGVSLASVYALFANLFVAHLGDHFGSLNTQ